MSDAELVRRLRIWGGTDPDNEPDADSLLAADRIESLSRELAEARKALTLVSKTDKWEHDIGQPCKCPVCAAVPAQEP